MCLKKETSLSLCAFCLIMLASEFMGGKLDMHYFLKSECNSKKRTKMFSNITTV
jgi:hypothetical protein